MSCVALKSVISVSAFVDATAFSPAFSGGRPKRRVSMEWAGAVHQIRDVPPDSRDVLPIFLPHLTRQRSRPWVRPQTARL